MSGQSRRPSTGISPPSDYRDLISMIYYVLMSYSYLNKTRVPQVMMDLTEYQCLMLFETANPRHSNGDLC